MQLILLKISEQIKEKVLILAIPNNDDVNLDKYDTKLSNILGPSSGYSFYFYFHLFSSSNKLKIRHFPTEVFTKFFLLKGDCDPYPLPYYCLTTLSSPIII